MPTGKFTEITSRLRKRILEKVYSYLSDHEVSVILAGVISYMQYVEIHACRGEHHDFVRNFIHLKHYIYNLEEGYPNIYAIINNEITDYLQTVTDFERRN